MPQSPEQFASRLRTFAVRIETDPFDEAKQQLLEEFGDSVATNFARRRNPDGSSFPPRKYKYRHPMLIKTGAMFLAETSPGSPGNKIEFQRRSVAMTIDDSAVPYMKHHHYGKGRLPRRRTFYLHRTDVPRMKNHLKVSSYRLFARTMNGT